VTFPPDPKAPGGPRRSEYLRECFGSPGRSDFDPSPEPEVAIRFSTVDEDDRESLRRLAALDDSPAPDAPVVLAELDGDPVAALSIGDGHAVEDPFRSNAGIIALLHLHRLQARVIGAIWGV
jgi:hypothetical protein